MLSYQSFMPAGAGTPRYENWVHWLVGVFRCHRHNPPLLDSGLRRNDELGAGVTKGRRELRMRGCPSRLSWIGVRDMLS